VKFALTDHAKEQIRARRISMRWVKQVMIAPQQVVAATEGAKAYQSQFPVRHGKILLRLIVIERKSINIVKTAYKTTRIAKYWRVE
jgi:hypothetical protein